MALENFTPLSATVGGILIGFAAVLLMALLGRIAGISGIASNLLPPRVAGDWAWRLAFILGLVLGAWLIAALGLAPPLTFPMGLPGMAVAGFLVGFGAVIGNGCTSGHGVCGIARLSKRSLVATATFMLAAIVVTYVVRHVVGG
jgi:uncharacterized membrane protein YedE/YeeE